MWTGLILTRLSTSGRFFEHGNKSFGFSKDSGFVSLLNNTELVRTSLSLLLRKPDILKSVAVFLLAILWHSELPKSNVHAPCMLPNHRDKVIGLHSVLVQYTEL